jgi:predicted aspartyl protease
MPNLFSGCAPKRRSQIVSVASKEGHSRFRTSAGKAVKMMGNFYTKCNIENVADRTKSVVLSKMLVDTGDEYTWVPAKTLEKIGVAREKKDVLFVMANGQQITRNVGFAIIRLDEHFTVDEVVFAEKGDLMLLGARSLEGLNLTVDSHRKKLVAAGPLPAALGVFSPV